MLIGWTGDNGDPDNWLGTLLGCEAVNGSNFSHWCYKPFNDLVDKGRVTSDQAQRTTGSTRKRSRFSRINCRSRRSLTRRSISRPEEGDRHEDRAAGLLAF